MSLDMAGGLRRQWVSIILPPTLITAQRWRPSAIGIKHFYGNRRVRFLLNGVRGLLPHGNRERALQVFDQIVHVFYSDRDADKVCW